MFGEAQPCAGQEESQSEIIGRGKCDGRPRTLGKDTKDTIFPKFTLEENFLEAKKKIASLTSKYPHFVESGQGRKKKSMNCWKEMRQKQEWNLSGCLFVRKEGRKEKEQRDDKEANNIISRMEKGNSVIMDSNTVGPI